MNRVAALIGLAMAASSLGCAMCSSPYDYAYAAYGGLRERQNMYVGRVGSVVDPAPAAAEPVLVPAHPGEDGPFATVRGPTESPPPEESEALPDLPPPESLDDLPDLPSDESFLDFPDLP